MSLRLRQGGPKILRTADLDDPAEESFRPNSCRSFLLLEYSIEGREYLWELLRDWRSAADVAGLLDELAQLSIGHLRTVETGLLDAT